MVINGTETILYKQLINQLGDVSEINKIMELFFYLMIDLKVILKISLFGLEIILE
jgi:hypothetical protein